jgi:hypothetical protein
MQERETGFTLIELLILMFWILCFSLLDGMVRHCLGLTAPVRGVNVTFLLGCLVCFATGLTLAQKHIGKQTTALMFGIPFGVAMLSVCFLRSWKETGYFVDFASGFYVPVLALWTIILLWIVLDSFPVCSSGQCRRRRDFAVSGSCYYSNKDRPVDGSTEYKCKCGDEYVRRGKRFMALDSERNPHHYKKLVGFHKWADDMDQ